MDNSSLYRPSSKELQFYSVDYKNPDCVQGLFRHYYKLKTMAQTTTNTELACIYLDLDEAVFESNLTGKQAEALKLYTNSKCYIQRLNTMFICCIK